MTAREFVYWMDNSQSARDMAKWEAEIRTQEEAENRYFDALSDVVEKHPPVRARVVRSPLRQ